MGGREREPHKKSGRNEGLDGGKQPECVRGADDEDGKRRNPQIWTVCRVTKRTWPNLFVSTPLHISFKKTRLPFIGNSSFLKKWGVTSSWPRPTALIIFVRTEASWRISTDFSFPQQRAQLALWPNTRESESIDCEACKLDNEVNSQILCKVAFLCCKFL